MKNKIRSLLLAVVCLSSLALAPEDASAQTTNTPSAGTNAPPAAAATPQSILTTAENFFASFDTTLTNAFPTARGDVWTAMDYQATVNIGAELGLDVPLRTVIPSSLTNHAALGNLTLESITRNASVAGVVTEQTVRLGYGLNVGDVQIIPALGGGYDFTRKKMAYDVGIDVKKMVSAHSFIIVGVALESTQPIVRVGTGINF